MKQAFIKMQKELDENKENIVSDQTQTDKLGEDLLVAFISDAKGQLTLATTLDLLLNGHSKTWPIILEQAKKIILSEALDPLMPLFYKEIFSTKDCHPDLLKVTTSDIIRLTGLDQKVEACVSL